MLSKDQAYQDTALTADVGREGKYMYSVYFHLSVRLSVCLSVCQSVCLSFCPSVCSCVSTNVQRKRKVYLRNGVLFRHFYVLPH